MEMPARTPAGCSQGVLTMFLSLRLGVWWNGRDRRILISQGEQGGFVQMGAQAVLVSRLLGPIANLECQVICSSSAEHRKEEADALWWFVYFSIVKAGLCVHQAVLCVSV